MGVEFRVLGPLELIADGRSVPLGGGKQRLLLAALLAYSNEVVSVARLSDIVWGDAPPADPEATLHTYVSRLRATFPANGAGGDHALIETRSPGYVLALGDDQLDAARFEHLVASARASHAAADASGALTELEDALSLWRGQAFAEFAHEDWVRAEASRLEELRVDALEERGELMLELGRHEELVAELEPLVSAHPYRERLWRQLMLALYRSGRQADALRACARLREQLRDELGIDPSAGTRDLEVEILSQAPALDWQAPGVTFPTLLFTDIERSTEIWDLHPDEMSAALERHDAILFDAVHGNRGDIVKRTGDGLCAVFASASDAIGAAAAGQRGLSLESWGVTGPLRVRMGLHTGRAEVRDGDYLGGAVNRAARLMAKAAGGQVLVSRSTTALATTAMSDDLSLVDLGEHHLRGLSRPEQVFQLVGRGLERDFPPIEWSDERAGNLPRQLTSFVGREAERAAVTVALREGQLVTLTGVGGVGKTRLALEVAGDLVPSAPDGAWLCELAATADPDEIVAVVAAALRVEPRPGMSLEDAVVESLRDKHALLVLDNCEHLLEAAGRLARAILTRCPAVRILATSREGLGVDGEQLWPLGSLPVPDASSDAAGTAAADAVRLFIERARSVRPMFTVDAGNAASVGEICRRVDGIPLAIELAAARVVSMTPTEILERLDERFQLLRTTSSSTVERHQTLHRTVEWSYSLLDRRDQLVFERLAVFSGTFNAAGAAAVCGEDLEAWDVVDALASLVSKSMVAVEETDDTTRYQMLETLRQFAWDRLVERGTAESARRRHAEHYARFAEEAGPGLEGPDELIWRLAIRAELDNLRAAVTWALDGTEPERRELAIRIVAAIAYASIGERAAGLGEWAERTIPYIDETTPGRRMAVLGVAAWTAYYRGDYDAAKALATHATRDGPVAGCPAPSLSYACLSLVCVQAGQPHEALERAIEADAAFDAMDASLRDRTDFYAFTAFCAAIAGDLEAARAHADRSLQLARSAGTPSALAHALYARGHVLAEIDPEAALAALDESIALTRAGASAFAFGAALHQAARLRAQIGDAGAAMQALKASVAHEHQRGSRPSIVITLTVGVDVLATLGYAEQAAVLAGVITGGPLAPLIADRIDSTEQVSLERALAPVREKLGADGYARCTARGAAMSYDEIIDYTLTELDQLPAPA
ncbi:MAG TPA: BTAD domain-containing putative transcriptional regulator [Acidimicrobiia bacterium]